MPINYAAIGSDAIATALTSRLEIRSYSDPERRDRQWDRGFVAPINPESLTVSYGNTLAGQVGLNSSGASLSVASNEAEEISFKLVLTDSSAFHYSGRNTFTLLNNYEADNFQNLGYSASRLLALANEETLGAPASSSTPASTTFFNSPVSPLHAGRNQIRGGSFPIAARDGHVALAIERFLNLTTQKALKKTGKEAQAAYLGLVWGRVLNRPGELTDGIFKAVRKRIYPCYLKSAEVNYTHFTRDGRALRAEIDCVFKEDSTDNG